MSTDMNGGGMDKITEQVEADMGTQGKAEGGPFMVIAFDEHGWMRSGSPLDRATADGVAELWSGKRYIHVTVHNNKFSANEYMTFLLGYLRAADFTHENIACSTAPAYLLGLFEARTLAEAQMDCGRFLRDVERAGIVLLPELMEQAGHDFWFTRNGHGVGFWDRPELYGETRANMLTGICRGYSEVNLIEGSDPIEAY